MPWSKLALALTLLAAAMVGGLFLSGFVVLHWLGLHDVSLHAMTYWAYLRARDLPQFAPWVTRIEFSGAIGFGVPMLAWLGLLMPLFKIPQGVLLQNDAPVPEKTQPSYYEAAEQARADALSRDPGEVEMQKSLQRAAAMAGLAMTAVTASSCAAQVTTHHAAQAAQPSDVQQRARFLLERLLVLIKQSKSIKDFTPEHIGEVFGVRLRTYGPSDYGYSEDLNNDWTWNIDRVDPSDGDPIMWDFTFRSDPGKNPDMTHICSLDYDDFIGALKAMGLRGESHYVEHGRMQYGGYSTGTLTLWVYPEGEANHPIEKIGHKCIWMIRVF